MGTDKPRVSTGQWAIAGVVVLAGAGILAAALTSDDAVDPAELHERNLERSRAIAVEGMEEALTSAAVAQESYFQRHERYAETSADLTAVGFRHDPGVLMTKVIVGPDTYCMEVQHDRLPGQTFSYFSDNGEVRREPCPF